MVLVVLVVILAQFHVQLLLDLHVHSNALILDVMINTYLNPTMDVNIDLLIVIVEDVQENLEVTN
jgi:hypothetical protein